MKAAEAPVPLEHDEQVALMQYANLQASRDERWALLFAIPNAGAGAQKGQAGKLKAEGVKPGVPDLMLPVAMAPYHGAFIEMKRRRGGVLSEDQARWRDALYKQRYRVYVARGWEVAAAYIADYLAGRFES